MEGLSFGLFSVMSVAASATKITKRGLTQTFRFFLQCYSLSVLPQHLSHAVLGLIKHIMNPQCIHLYGPAIYLFEFSGMRCKTGLTRTGDSIDSCTFDPRLWYGVSIWFCDDVLHVRSVHLHA